MPTRPQKGKPGKAAARGQAPAKPSPPDHKRELVALVLFGVAVFLIVILIMGDAGGFVGRGVKTGLIIAFGRLAYLVPAALIAAGVTTVMQVRFWRSYRFAGLLVLVVGLFLLLAAAVPPFSDRADDLFVRADFEGRAGGLGEAFYAVVHRLVGMVGVGIIAWVAMLAGFSLLTGITGHWVGRRT